MIENDTINRDDIRCKCKKCDCNLDANRVWPCLSCDGRHHNTCVFCAHDGCPSVSRERRAKRIKHRREREAEWFAGLEDRGNLTFHEPTVRGCGCNDCLGEIDWDEHYEGIATDN